MTHLPARHSSSHAPRRRSGALRSAPLVVAVACVLALLGAATVGAAPAPVGLGTATSFAVLAGAGVTNTGATTIAGDIGTFPTTSQTGFGTIVQTGVNHAGDAVTEQAKIDLVTAFDDAASRGPVTAAVPVDLAGQVLTPGVYSSGTIELSGALTLDAQGDPDAVFVFQAASTLITGSASTVTIINGGATTACNIFWKVGSSATLGSGSSFVGTVLAQESISLDSSAVVEGRVLARTGAVTMINNTITNTGCPTLPTAGPTTPTTPTTAPGDTGGSTDGGGSGSGSGTDGSGTGTGVPAGPPTDRTLAFTGTDPRIAVLGLALLTTGMMLAVASGATRRRAER
jgi:hypothetical protein